MPKRISHNWKLHLFIVAAAVAALVLSILIGMGVLSAESLFGICGFKRKYNLPCPFCGMTRSFSFFFRGRFISSLTVQPAGFMLAAILSVSGICSAAELFGHKTLFYRELRRGKRLAIVFVCIFIIGLVSWVYTIFKYRFL
ncbi:DUF2752 domain-containing protein [Limihaloglobus sulfuriphilus]|uniref:DUF2752 domain-containing protein n=1 Tax=Limihaloglobus sulfuriphilus TaxID=1851148 RepID=UPI0011BAC289